MFNVRNACCGEMTLLLKFSVTKEDMSLVGMRLNKIYRLSNGNSSL